MVGPMSAAWTGADSHRRLGLAVNQKQGENTDTHHIHLRPAGRICASGSRRAGKSGKLGNGGTEPIRQADRSILASP